MTSSENQHYPTGLYNFWVYSTLEGDKGVTPLLFVDRGTTVLHVDSRGPVFLSDSITRKLRQQLNDDGTLGHHNGMYHEGTGDGVLHVVCLCPLLNLTLG